jgi:hypothetical protein
VADNGDVYVANRANPPSILVYHKGQSQPWRTITSSLIAVPWQLLFDHSGTLYVADNQNGVLVIRPGSSQVQSLNLRLLDGCTTGLALDPRKRWLFVSDCVGGTQVYKLGNPYPLRSLVEQFPADDLGMGKLGGREVLFAPDLNSNVVYFYYADANTPFYALQTGVITAIGVAYKPPNVP